jgi:hypothetical protein
MLAGPTPIRQRTPDCLQLVDFPSKLFFSKRRRKKEYQKYSSDSPAEALLSQ